jgi:S-adenosylmethionine:tRNA ribosyltransferase-isomerase
MHLSDFQYELPESSIAQRPVEPRDSSWLLDTTTMRDHRFSDLPALLDPGDLVVVNNTRVRHARLRGHKRETGGKVEVLILGMLADGTWEALIRPARRIATGVALVFGGLSATVASDPIEGRIRLRFEEGADVEAAFDQVGEVPLPPYITAPLDQPERYQTIYAERTGSSAAPTAGLHFTDGVIRGLQERSIDMTSVELQVGLGTFRPISVDDVTQHAMHSEWFHVSRDAADAIDRARARGGRVVAIGTTVVRTLESVATGDGRIEPGSGETNLYLTPGATFNVVDRLVTNFHLPGSSLLVLLAAFMGPGWRAVYETAVHRGYRFLSFGDAMICERR